MTLRIMSIHHLDTFRYWLGDPRRVFASVRPDPRTKFKHEDGICLYILEYDNGAASAWDDVWAGPVRRRRGRHLHPLARRGHRGMARGTIGWPSYPRPHAEHARLHDETATRLLAQPRWKEAWFPDAFVGPMAELLLALEQNASRRSAAGTT